MYGVGQSRGSSLARHVDGNCNDATSSAWAPQRSRRATRWSSAAAALERRRDRARDRRATCRLFAASIVEETPFFYGVLSAALWALPLAARVFVCEARIRGVRGLLSCSNARRPEHVESQNVRLA